MNNSVIYRPELIVFDLDSTIYEYLPCRKAAEKRFFDYAYSEIGIKPRISKHLYTAARINVKNRIQGASSHERYLYFIEYLRLAGKKSNALFIEEPFSLYWTSYFENMYILPGFEDFVTKARLSNIATALVTNMTSEIQYRKILYLQIDHLFDYLITSQETQLEKISYQPYELLMTNFAKDKSFKSVWFLGDSEGDFPTNFPTEKYYHFISPFSDLKKVDKGIKFQSYLKLTKILDESILI